MTRSVRIRSLPSVLEHDRFSMAWLLAECRCRMSVPACRHGSWHVCNRVGASADVMGSRCVLVAMLLVAIWYEEYETAGWRLSCGVMPRA